MIFINISLINKSCEVANDTKLIIRIIIKRQKIRNSKYVYDLGNKSPLERSKRRHNFRRNSVYYG
jgi:hypothetical protein